MRTHLRSIKNRTTGVICLILVVLFLGDAQAQKGTFGISGGPFASIPFRNNGFRTQLKTGGGFAALPQYNFSTKSSVLASISVSRHGTKFDNISLDTGTRRRTTFHSFKVGYRYQFSRAGLFTAILLGREKYSVHNFKYRVGVFSVGVGKHFTLNNNYFIDTGLEYVNSATYSRLNVTTAFGLLGRFKQ